MSRVLIGLCPCGGEVTGTYARGERTITAICSDCGKRRKEEAWRNMDLFQLNTNLTEVLDPLILSVLEGAEASRTASNIARHLQASPQRVGKRCTEMDQVEKIDSSIPRYKLREK